MGSFSTSEKRNNQLLVFVYRERVGLFLINKSPAFGFRPSQTR